MRKLIALIALLSIFPAAPEEQKPKQRPKPAPSAVQPNQKPAPSCAPKQEDPPISNEEAAAVLQVAGGFLQILTAPQNPTNVTTGIGAMVSGMANLFYQLMKSRGMNPELNDEELQELACEMALRVTRGVEIEMVRRNFRNP